MIPRLATYYESRLGRNDGNPLYVTYVLRRDYPQLEVHHLAPDPALQFESFGRFDFHLWVDWGEDALTGLLPYVPMACPRPNLYWASDTHLGPDYRYRKADEFDHVGFAQRKAVAEYGRGIWLPHAVEPDVYNPAAIYADTPEKRLSAVQVMRVKKWDVCFVGHLNTGPRIAFLDRMFREFPNAWYGSRRTGRLFERAAEVYTQTRVVLNDAARDDVNMRVFEALATRSCLLTPVVDGLDDLFEDGVHLVTYRTVDEAIEKTFYYLKHEDEREQIADCGYREVMARHTMAHRVARILEVGGIHV